MDYIKAINLYLGYEVQCGIDYGLVDYSDSYGVRIEYWNIQNKSQPTIEQLELLNNQLIFNDSVQYQHDSFNEYQNTINSQVQTLTNLKEANKRINNNDEFNRIELLIEYLQDQLLTEQNAVIKRINQITLEYNGGST